MSDILLIGTGPMAMDYAQVLKGMQKSFTVIGRGEESARQFGKVTGVYPIIGGVKKYLEENKVSSETKAIVAVGTEALMSVLLDLKEAGIKSILIEKPAAISVEELLAHKERLVSVKSTVFVAYNRRFYASVIEAQRLIEEDGGLQSMHFEFTEWAHTIEPLEKAKGVKENWFFANSTHVVDLAFFMAGKPTDWKAFSKSGILTWHNKTNYSGAGLTEKGVVFSYISNWESAGRWGIELMTSRRRIYLKPMEDLSIQFKGTIVIDKHEFDLSIDQQFKPGLYLQTDAFLNGVGKGRLLTLSEHFDHSAHIYSKMLA